MAYTELHTAAIRLVHVTKPNDRDVDYLTREFHLAPEETEAMLGVVDNTTTHITPEYRRLTVQWPTPTRRGITLTDVHCFVGSGWLVIVDHGNFPAADDLTQELQSVPPERLWQDGPMMMLYELWRRAIRELQRYDHSVPAQYLTAYTRIRTTVGESLKNFAAAHPDSATDPAMVKGFAFLAFSFGHLLPTSARQPVATTTRLPLTARGYAAASAAVAIVTLLVVSQTL